MKKSLFALVQVLFSAALVAEASSPKAPPKTAGRAADPAVTRAGPTGRAIGDAPGAVALGAPSTAPTPAEFSDVATRLRAAKSAVLAPAEMVPRPQPSASAVAPAPLAARIGRDVTLRRRPGVGTPMQIVGERLQTRRQAATPGGDDDLETAREFLRANRGLLLLADPDTELSTRQASKDELGYRHLKFAQRFRGLSVWPNELIVHLDRDSSVYLMNGTFVPTPRLATVQPVVSAAAALRIATSEAAGGRPAKTGEPELFIYAPGNRPPRLAWRAVVSPSLMESWLVVVDAINGARLAKISEVQTEDVAGSGVDSNGLTRQLRVWKEGAEYYLIDTSKPMYDPSSDPPDYKTTRGAIFIYDAENTPPNSDPSLADATWFFVISNTPTSWTSPHAVSAAFGLGWTFDYYRENHARNSLDGNGGAIYSLVRIGIDYQNAFWNGSENAMCFGDGDNWPGSLDVVGARADARGHGQHRRPGLSGPVGRPERGHVRRLRRDGGALHLRFQRLAHGLGPLGPDPKHGGPGTVRRPEQDVGVHQHGFRQRRRAQQQRHHQQDFLQSRRRPQRRDRHARRREDLLQGADGPPDAELASFWTPASRASRRPGRSSAQTRSRRSARPRLSTRPRSWTRTRRRVPTTRRSTPPTRRSSSIATATSSSAGGRPLWATRPRASACRTRRWPRPGRRSPETGLSPSS